MLLLTSGRACAVEKDIHYNGTFQSSAFSNSVFYDCTFHNCAFHNCKFFRCKFNRCLSTQLGQIAGKLLYRGGISRLNFGAMLAVAGFRGHWRALGVDRDTAGRVGASTKTAENIEGRVGSGGVQGATSNGDRSG